MTVGNLDKNKNFRQRVWKNANTAITRLKPRIMRSKEHQVVAKLGDKAKVADTVVSLLNEAEADTATIKNKLKLHKNATIINEMINAKNIYGVDVGGTQNFRQQFRQELYSLRSNDGLDIDKLKKKKEKFLTENKGLIKKFVTDANAIFEDNAKQNKTFNYNYNGHELTMNALAAAGFVKLTSRDNKTKQYEVLEKVGDAHAPSSGSTKPIVHNDDDDNRSVASSTKLIVTDNNVNVSVASSTSTKNSNTKTENKSLDSNDLKALSKETLKARLKEEKEKTQELIKKVENHTVKIQATYRQFRAKRDFKKDKLNIITIQSAVRKNLAQKDVKSAFIKKINKEKENQDVRKIIDFIIEKNKILGQDNSDGDNKSKTAESITPQPTTTVEGSVGEKPETTTTTPVSGVTSVTSQPASSERDTSGVPSVNIANSNSNVLDSEGFDDDDSFSSFMTPPQGDTNNDAFLLNLSDKSKKLKSE